jgi:3',5'-cyclic AMP phosphodiesterase CpdA
VLIAQITDTHIRPEGSLAYGHVDTSAFLARAVDHILHLDPRPDVVLGTGDLVDGGTPAEYARLRHLLSPLPWARPAGGAGRGDETQGSGARKVVCVPYVPRLYAVMTAPRAAYVVSNSSFIIGKSGGTASR